MLQRPGRATAGAQDASGTVFSADQFPTNWNKLAPEAKKSLFGSLPGGYSQSVDQIVANVSKLKAYGKVLGARSHAFSGFSGFTTGAIVEALLSHGIPGILKMIAAYGVRANRRSVASL